MQRFWAQQPDNLGERQAEVLERLLAMEDHDLWDLLSGRRQEGDPDLQGMVTLLRQPASN